MAHHHLRNDKTCLNCGAIVDDRYCSHCGQENTEPRESVGHLLWHFFDDVTHYDSQFFKSIKYLIFRPGFLTREYYAGRRASYLNPIRMYIFISAVFFVIMFSEKKEENGANPAKTATHDVKRFSQHLADSLRSKIKLKGHLAVKDSVSNKLYHDLAARLDTPAKKDTSESLFVGFGGSSIIFTMHEGQYSSIHQYDFVQNKLPDTKKDDIMSRYIVKKAIRLKHEQKNGGDITVTQNIEHNIPKIMFVLLPLFALFIRFFYSRKKYLYTQHVIFSLHFHSFIFIFMLIMSLVPLVVHVESLGAIKVIISITLLGIFIYLTAALYGVYREGLWRSIMKALGISALYLFTIVFSLCALLVVSFMLI